jgi:XTP/dITP diphosphohydrolase
MYNKRMLKIVFATGNNRKLAEARAACKDFNIHVEQMTVEINEIQHHDPVEIAKHKAAEAYRLVKSPVVINDTSWSMPSLKGFPGGYMKDVKEWFEAQDFINLANSKNDNRINFIETIIYIDGETTKIFNQEYKGKIADKPRGTGNSLESIAEFDGVTLAERHDRGEFSHKPEEYIWYQFATWFSKKNITKG